MNPFKNVSTEKLEQWLMAWGRSGLYPPDAKQLLESYFGLFDELNQRNPLGSRK